MNVYSHSSAKVHGFISIEGTIEIVVDFGTFSFKRVLHVILLIKGNDGTLWLGLEGSSAVFLLPSPAMTAFIQS